MRRRQFLQSLPLGFAGLAAPLAFGRKASGFTHAPLVDAMLNGQDQDNDRILVIIWLAGGNDGLNTVIPFEDPLYIKLRETTGFRSSDERAQLVHKIREDLALNPSLSSLYPLWQEGKCAIVQNVGLTNPDLSHFRATDIWNSASDTDLMIPTGWIARWQELGYPNYPTDRPRDPIAISMGDFSSSMFFGDNGQMDILIKDPSSYQPSGASVSPEVGNTYGGRELKFVQDLINVTDDYATRFGDLFPKYAKNTVTYPDNILAPQLRNIAQCIASGLKTKIYFTKLDGFDHHSLQFSKDESVEFGHAWLLRTLGDSVAAFQQDLEGLGVADRVITMTYSEFGRRVFENGNGTDHGTCAPQFIFGTNVNAGLYGHHPDLEHLDSVSYDPINEFDFRQFYAAILGDWFGVSEDVRQMVLSPGRMHAPFAKDFPVNGAPNDLRSLIAVKPKGVRQSPSVGESVFDSVRLLTNPIERSREIQLSFTLNKQTNVECEVIDIRGVRQRVSYSRQYSQGVHRVEIASNGLASGHYFVKLTTSRASDFWVGRVEIR